MDPRVGLVGTNSDLCVGDLLPYVGYFSKGTADNLSTEDNIVHVSSGTPTPELAGSDNVPTKNLKGCISLLGNESSPANNLEADISQGNVSSSTNTDWRAPSGSMEVLGARLGSPCVRSRSDTFLNMRSAISGDNSSPGRLSESTEALKTSRGGLGVTRSQSMIPECEKKCSADKSLGSPVTAKLRSRFPCHSTSPCLYQVMLQLGAEPRIRRKVGTFATRSLSNLLVPLPLPTTLHETLTGRPSNSSASRVSLAARHRSKSSKCVMSTEDIAPFSNGVLLPSGTDSRQMSQISRKLMSTQALSANSNVTSVGRQRSHISRKSTSTQGLSAGSNVTSVSRQLSSSSQAAVRRQLSTGSRTLCWATPLQIAMQHGCNLTAPKGSDLSDKSQFSPSGR
eukprot:gene24794-10438_t